MNFFQYLFCNQYAKIKEKGGDERRAQFFTIIISTGLISLYIILIVVVYGRTNPPYLEKLLSWGMANNQRFAWFFAAVTNLTVFYSLKYFIGSKDWYAKTVEQYKNLLPEEQKQISKRGARYVFVASLPVIIFVMWAVISVF